MSDRIRDTDAQEQIRQLRDQVEGLMRDRVAPALSGATQQAREMAGEQAEKLSGQIKERPIAAVLIAAATGYLIGRLSR